MNPSNDCPLSTSAASASGRGGRRASAESLATAAKVVSLRKEGLDNTTIARRLGISRRAVLNYLKAAGWTERSRPRIEVA